MRAIFVSLFLWGCVGEVAIREVPQPKIASLEFSPSLVELDAIGAMEQMQVLAKDERGETIRDVDIEWSSDDPDVVEIGVGRIVESIGPGTTCIRARVRGTAVEAEAQVIVNPIPRRLVFVSQPRSITVGEPLGVPLEVAAIDRLGVPVSGYEEKIRLTLLHPLGGSLVGNSEGQTFEGIAPFSELTVHESGQRLRLRATSSELPPEESEPFDVLAGPPDRFVFGELETIVWGEAFNVSAILEDRFGNPADVEGMTFRLSLRDPKGEAVLLGKSTADSRGGIVRWNGISIETRAIMPPRIRCFEGFRYELAAISDDSRFEGHASVKMRIPFVSLKDGAWALNAAGWIYRWDDRALYAEVWRMEARIAAIGDKNKNSLSHRACTFDVDGKVQCFDNGAFVEVPLPLGDVVSTMSHQTALMQSGKVFWWNPGTSDPIPPFEVIIQSDERVVRIYGESAITATGELFKWGWNQKNAKLVRENVLDVSEKCTIEGFQQGHQKVECTMFRWAHPGETLFFVVPEGERFFRTFGYCFLAVSGNAYCLEPDESDPRALLEERAKMPHPEGLRFVDGAEQGVLHPANDGCLLDEEGRIFCRGRYAGQGPEHLDAYLPIPLVCDGYL